MAARAPIWRAVSEDVRASSEPESSLPVSRRVAEGVKTVSSVFLSDIIRISTLFCHNHLQSFNLFFKCKNISHFCFFMIRSDFL